MTGSMVSYNWHLGERPDLGAMNAVNRLIRAMDFSDPNALPEFRYSEQLLITSDYGGQHSTANREAYCFLITDALRLGPWLHAQSALRASLLRGGRRMAFKSLGDKNRLRALPAFLSAADLVCGLLVVVLVNKQVGTLFARDQEESIDQQLTLEGWSPRTAERLLRVCHFAALFVAGLSRPGQHLMWITDQDDIAANSARHQAFVRAFSTIASHYLEHSLGHLRIATTASDTGRLDVEDLTSLADLAAGAVGHILDAYDQAKIPIAQKLIAPTPMLVSSKAREIMNWFSVKHSCLKRLVISIEPSEDSKVLVRQYVFAGSNDPQGKWGNHF